MNHILRSILYKLTCKRVDENNIDFMQLNVSEDDVSYFNLSTNSILLVNVDGKTYYFRECPRIISRDRYFKNAVNNFFETLEQVNTKSESFNQEVLINTCFLSEDVIKFREYVFSLIKNNRYIRALSATDVVSERVSFSIWERRDYNRSFFENFGMGDLPDGTEDIAVYFLWCMRSAAISFRLFSIAKGKNYSFFSAVRAYSSVIIAEALGLDNMITDTRWCKLNISNGKELFGMLSEPAPGFRASDAELSPDGSLQRELLCLNVLDYICFQKDHGPNNYSVLVEDGCSHICAFDNDNPFTFFPMVNVSDGLSGCAPLISSEGIIDRPYFDNQLADAILNLDVQYLLSELKPFLNFIQLKALCRRISDVQTAIIKTMKSKSDFLLNKTQWNDQTLKTELSDSYGLTYLKKALMK